MLEPDATSPSATATPSPSTTSRSTSPTGQVLAVLGPSGCGKSTLLRAVAGLEPLAPASIACDGARPRRRADPQARLRADVPGRPALRPPDRRPQRGLRPPAAAYAVATRPRSRELLELVGLAGYDDRLPGTLSGGERQRVALARALAVEPRLILLDEPLSALDADLRERLAGDLREILHAAGTTALLVTHDHEEAFALADRLAVMRDGRVVQSGAIDEVWRAPVDEETALFLGYARVLPATRRDGCWPRPRRPRLPAVARRRRTPLRPGGRRDGAAVARVESARVTPEQVRLVVERRRTSASSTRSPRCGSRVAPGRRRCAAGRCDPSRRLCRS